LILNDNTVFIQPLYHYKNTIDMNMKKAYPSDQYFLIRLIKYGKITMEDYHIQMGYMSGYKKCCIDNFIKLLNYGPSKFVGVSAYMDKKYGSDLKEIHHVRCKKCRVIKKEIK